MTTGSRAPADERFSVPAGFEEVPMPVFGAANDDEANPLGGLFGKRGGG